jgi:hypothetical protein
MHARGVVSPGRRLLFGRVADGDESSLPLFRRVALFARHRCLAKSTTIDALPSKDIPATPGDDVICVISTPALIARLHRLADGTCRASLDAGAASSPREFQTPGESVIAVRAGRRRNLGAGDDAAEAVRDAPARDESPGDPERAQAGNESDVALRPARRQPDQRAQFDFALRGATAGARAAKPSSRRRPSIPCRSRVTNCSPNVRT